MASRVHQYLACAAECERRAARATDPEVHAAYRAMIRCWLELANRAEWLELREDPIAAPLALAISSVAPVERPVSPRAAA